MNLIFCENKKLSLAKRKVIEKNNTIFAECFN